MDNIGKAIETLESLINRGDSLITEQKEATFFFERFFKTKDANVLKRAIESNISTRKKIIESLSWIEENRSNLLKIEELVPIFKDDLKSRETSLEGLLECSYKLENSMEDFKK